MVFITNKSICLYRNTGVFFVLMMCWLACSAQSGNNSMYDYSSKVDSVLSLMTLDVYGIIMELRELRIIMKYSTENNVQWRILLK